MSNDSDSPADREKSLSTGSPVFTVPREREQRRGAAARHPDLRQETVYSSVTKRQLLVVWLVLVGIVITATIFVLYGLTRSPATWDDEVFFAEPARMFASTGSLSAPMFFNIAGFSHYFYYQPPVYFLVMAGAYRVLGFNETVARLGSATPYIVGIVAAFFLARSVANRVGLDRLFCSCAGLLAAFLLAFNEQSLEMARSARSDWLAVLLLFLGWLCVSKAARAPTRTSILVSAGFVLMLLATLTHPALGGPAVGIIVAVIFCGSRLGISRRTALVGCLASAALVLLPYGMWIFPHFDVWRSQFLDGTIAAGSGNYESFLSTQVGNVAEVVEYAPAIVAVILIGLAVFPWRVSPDALGAIIGASAVAAASTDPYMKFLLLISLVPATAGVIRLCAKTKTGKRYRQLTVALVLLALMNGLAFPVLRAYTIRQFYQQRDPMLVTENIERFVPRGAHLMGIPAVYFAAIADGAEFRQSQLLYGVRWGNTASLQSQFRRAVEQYNPTWFALPPGMQPDSEYCYLPDRFLRVSTINEQISSGLNVSGQSSVAYVLWTTTDHGATPECRT
jgi:4-amino-4-deoxy-L-arabinose transferase-like glycosyltransferase